MERKEISKSVLKRLPGYLSYLKSIPQGSSPYISATALANALGMGEVQVRKDLAMVCDGGRPKIGYPRELLIDAIEQLKDTTQLIVISHQRRTMEQADVLYGVSMQADGVSHVVSQRLDRATGKVVDA